MNSYVSSSTFSVCISAYGLAALTVYLLGKGVAPNAMGFIFVIGLFSILILIGNGTIRKAVSISSKFKWLTAVCFFNLFALPLLSAWVSIIFMFLMVAGFTVWIIYLHAILKNNEDLDDHRC